MSEEESTSPTWWSVCGGPSMIGGGLVRRLALYWDRERAFADLGLKA